MNDKKEENNGSRDTQPKILESEEKVIQERKPPNERILYFNLEEDQ